jgi:hypothetical protein
VKWRADQKKPSANGEVRCLCYIDSRLAEERLGEVDPSWVAEYKFIAGNQSDPVGHGLYAPTMCALTVQGVTRFGVGQIAGTKPGANTVKSAVSDAIKRAGVEFGIGAYLYALPVFKVDKKGYWAKGTGDVGGLTPAGVKQLRAQYAKVVDHPAWVERFGEATDYGDVADDERSATPVEADHTDEPVAAFAKQPAGAAVKRGDA